jgi:hypothetical protein
LIDIIKQQLQTSVEAYNCCRFTRALALYTQLAALPAASLLYSLHSSLTHAQLLARSSAALPN